VGSQEGWVSLKRCYLDIIVYETSRKAAKDRAKPQGKVIGITNMIVCLEGFEEERYYWVMGESDSKVSLQKVFECCRSIGAEPVLVIETAKGLHVYTNLLEKKAKEAFKKIRKLEKCLGGNAHKLGKFRKELFGEERVVLRISKKYSEPDMKVLYLAKEVSSSVLAQALKDRIELGLEMEAFQESKHSNKQE